MSSAPAPLPGDLYFVSARKGIYKPADLPYALSIKIKLNSRYADGVPVPTPGGGWLLEYHQENDDPAARDTTSANNHAYDERLRRIAEPGKRSLMRH